MTFFVFHPIVTTLLCLNLINVVFFLKINVVVFISIIMIRNIHEDCIFKNLSIDYRGKINDYLALSYFVNTTNGFF